MWACIQTYVSEPPHIFHTHKASSRQVPLRTLCQSLHGQHTQAIVQLVRLQYTPTFRDVGRPKLSLTLDVARLMGDDIRLNSAQCAIYGCLTCGSILYSLGRSSEDSATNGMLILRVSILGWQGLGIPVTNSRNFALTSLGQELTTWWRQGNYHQIFPAQIVNAGV